MIKLKSSPLPYKLFLALCCSLGITTSAVDSAQGHLNETEEVRNLKAVAEIYAKAKDMLKCVQGYEDNPARLEGKMLRTAQMNKFLDFIRSFEKKFTETKHSIDSMLRYTTSSKEFHSSSFALCDNLNKSIERLLKNASRNTSNYGETVKQLLDKGINENPHDGSPRISGVINKAFYQLETNKEDQHGLCRLLGTLLINFNAETKNIIKALSAFLQSIEPEPLQSQPQVTALPAAKSEEESKDNWQDSLNETVYVSLKPSISEE